MRFKDEVSKFAASCEHLMSGAESSSTKLSEEEALLVEMLLPGGAK